MHFHATLRTPSSTHLIECWPGAKDASHLGERLHRRCAWPFGPITRWGPYRARIHFCNLPDRPKRLPLLQGHRRFSRTSHTLHPCGPARPDQQAAFIVATIMRRAGHADNRRLHLRRGFRLRGSQSGCERGLDGPRPGAWPPSRSRRRTLKTPHGRLAGSVNGTGPQGFGDGLALPAITAPNGPPPVAKKKKKTMPPWPDKTKEPH